MRIRNALLAVAATVAAGSAIAAPAMAQDFYRPVYEHGYAPPPPPPVYERPYAPAYEGYYGYRPARFDGYDWRRAEWLRHHYRWDHYRHDYGYRPY